MLRMPLHPVALELLRDVGPLAVSSANISGRPPGNYRRGSPRSARRICQRVSRRGQGRTRRCFHDRRPDRQFTAYLASRWCRLGRIHRRGIGHQSGKSRRGSFVTMVGAGGERAGESTYWGPDFGELATADPEIAAVALAELERQRDGLQLIASENFTSPSVLAALGSTLSNKYAEGYPGRALLRRVRVRRRSRESGDRSGKGAVRRRAPSTSNRIRGPLRISRVYARIRQARRHRIGDESAARWASDSRVLASAFLGSGSPPFPITSIRPPN